jgi:hypothetical protein
MATEYIPPAAYTPAVDRLVKDPNNADLRKDARREELLYDTVEHAARRLMRLKQELAEAVTNRTMGEVLPIARQAYTAELEVRLWQIVTQATGPAMREPLDALRDTVGWARGQALDALDDRAEDLTDARIFARWVRKAEEVLK